MKALLRILRQQYLGALALFVVLGGVATAATGDFLKLGASNSADKTTVLQSTAQGPGLDIRVPANQPPLRVNSRRQVPQLNASLLGGKRPNEFAPATGSLNYLSADGPNVLYSGATGGTNSGQILVNEFLAPADGTITVLVSGYCAGGTDHTFIIKIEEAQRSTTMPGGAGCSFGFSAEVSGPDTASVEVQWNPLANSTFYGAVLVFFEPS